MSVITNELKDIINDRESVKIIATSDQNGSPTIAFKGCLTVLDNGDLAFAEAFEGSQTNINLTRSIWFNRDVSMSVRSKDGKTYTLKGKPHKFLYTGPIFRKFYEGSRKKWGDDAELAGVWLITPFEATEQSYELTREAEDKKHPFFRHLDRESVLRRRSNTETANSR